MSASSLVADAVWKEIESTGSVATNNKLKMGQFQMISYPSCISCLVRTLSEQQGSWIKEVSKGFQDNPVDDPCFRLWENPEERRSIYVLQSSIVHVTHSSMTLLTEETSFVYPIVQCKHQLAARLADSLGACIEVQVSDEEVAVLLSKL